MTAPTRALTVGLILVVLLPAASFAAPPQGSDARPRITVEYRGSLRDALKTIASKGGLNLVVTGKLDQDAEVYLKDVTAEEALRTVAQAYQLKIQQSGSIWTLRPLTPAEIDSAAEHPEAPHPPPQPGPGVLPGPPGPPGPPTPGDGLPHSGHMPPIPPIPPLPPIVSGMPQQAIEAAMREAEAMAERAEADAEAAVEKAEHEAERLREQADEAGEGARAQAEEMRERAHELRERAREARERAREARQSAREALREARRTMKNERVGTGSVVVGEGEVVERAVAYGGSLTINGHVEEDAVAIGGSISLGPKAWVEGDVVAIGGSISRAEGAVVEGDVEALGGSVVGQIVKNSFREVRQEVRKETQSHHRGSDSPLAEFLVWFMVLFGTGFLGHLLVPQRMKLIQEEVHYNPLKSGLSGLLGALALAPLTVLLIITVVGIPVALLVLWPLAFLGAALGFTAVASELGTRLPVFRGRKTQAVVMALGLVLMLVVAMIPLGAIPIVLLAFIGFGAVVRTRFGTRGGRPGGPLDQTNIPDATPA